MKRNPSVAYSVYNVETGRILRSGSCLKSDRAAQAGPGEAVLTKAYSDAEFYVAGKKPAARPVIYANDAATIEGDGIDELVIGNVPEGTEVSLDGLAVGTIEDGQLSYASIEPGEHHLWLRPPTPWREQHIRVTVK